MDAYNSVKGFAAKLGYWKPELFDRLKSWPDEKMQVDYVEDAPNRKLGATRYRNPHLFVATWLVVDGLSTLTPVYLADRLDRITWPNFCDRFFSRCLGSPGECPTPADLTPI